MSRGYQELNVDGEAVKLAMLSSRNVEEYKRYQSVHLRVNEDMDVAAISRITGLSEGSIHNLHSRCRKEGISAVLTSSRGGRRRSYLSIEEEAELLASVREEACRGGILEVGIVHRAFEERVNGDVSLFTTYRMLHRHGWRKIMPRPRHPKADKEVQEAFKKTGQKSLKKPGAKPKR